MKRRTLLAAGTLAVAVAAVVGSAGCAVVHDQESIGSYASDAAITAEIKSRFVASKSVDAAAIRVETMHGDVLLTGFARSPDEKAIADGIARNTRGVKDVHDQIVVGG